MTYTLTQEEYDALRVKREEFDHAIKAETSRRVGLFKSAFYAGATKHLNRCGNIELNGESLIKLLTQSEQSTNIDKL